MSPDTTVRSALSRALRQALPWVLALAVATCSDDSTGPSRGGVGYFSFRPVYTGVTSSLSQFGISADSVHIRLTRPVDELVLDTTVFFPPDSTALHLSLPVALEVSPEVLSALIEIKAQGTVLFVDTIDVQVVDGPPGSTPPATATLDYVGPGNNIASITIAPSDTTIFFGDTLFYTSSAIDSSSIPVLNYYVGWKTSDTTFAKVNGQGRLIAPNVRGTLQVIGYTPTGIADTANITIAPVPGTIVADSGVAQVGQVGDSLATLFVAKVLGPDLLPIEGIHVRFVAVTAGGAVRDTLLVTDVNGRVRTRGVLGTATGSYTYSATVVGTAIATTWTATATPGLPVAIAVQSGNAQTDTAGRALPLPLTVRVADAFNNPVTGAKVYWTRLTGTGTVAADSSLTNASGLASTGYTLAAVGTDSIKSSLAGTSGFVWFTATAINGAPATVTLFGGNAQTDTVGRLLTDSLVVEVKSAQTLPVVGTPVVWTVLRGGVVSSDTSFTDANGHAAAAYTLGTVTGTDSVQAKAGNANAIFTATALTGAPAAIAVVSGDAQTDTTGLALPLSFAVRVADAFDNPVVGTKVNWNVVSGSGLLSADSSITDSNGGAAVGYTLGAIAGTDTISASLACGCGSVTFTATAIPAAPASITTVSGDSQTVVVNTVADTFAVVVRDGANTPLAGVKVNWAFIPAVGSFTEILPAGIQQSFTDSLGVARGVYTAGTSAGTVRVEAQVGSHIDSIYVFAIPAAPSAIAITGGDAQADTTGYVLTTPLSVRVADAFNNAVAGAEVVFTTTGGDGSVAPDTVLTDLTGHASATATLGSTPGINSYRATLAGTGAFVDFNATGILPTPFAIQPFSGDLQSDTAARALQEPLIAQVFSAGFVPLPGTKVVWHVIRGGSVSADTTVTDSEGNTTVNYTLGTLTGVDSVEARTLDGSVIFIFTASVANELPGLMTLFSGDAQSDTAGFTLSAPFVVQVTDQYGNIAGGAEVAFDVITGDGHVASDTVFADGAGKASTFFTLGATPGTNVVRASLINTSAIVDFTATGVAQAPASLIIASGSGQVDTVGRPLADSLVARVYNGSSVPIAGVPLIWTVLRGGSLDVDTTISDSLGFVVAHYTLGTVAGKDSVQVRTLNGALTAVVEAVATNQVAAQIAIFSGNGQSDSAGHAIPLPFVPVVTDVYGNPVAGETVAFTRIAGSGTLFADSGSTNVNGEIAVGYLFGSMPGVDTIRATLLSTGGFVDFTATTIAGTPASITFLFGAGQTDTVGHTLADSLLVEVQDQGGHVLGGIPIAWTARNGAPSADTTVTDSLGLTWVHFTLGLLAAQDTVDATSVGGSATAFITVNATPDAPSAIAIVSGDAQVDTTGRALPIPLIARVTDAYGNPVKTAPVALSITAGGGSFTGPDTVGTAGDGTITTVWTLGTVPGTNTLNATLAGTSATVDFTATAVAGTPASISFVSGYSQTDTVARALAESLMVFVQDQGGQPLGGIPLVWSARHGATTSADTTVTDTLGHAWVFVTLGTISGKDTIDVRTTDSAVTSYLTVDVTPDVPSAIAIVSGDAQSDTAGRALPLPLVAKVTDAYGNGVPGAAVLPSVTAGGGTLSYADTTFSAGDGTVSFALTLGAMAGTNTVRAALVGTSAFIDFTATGATAAAGSVVAIGGYGQTDTVGFTLTDSLKIRALDGGFFPLVNAPVVWTVLRGGVVAAETTYTDTLGYSATPYTLGTVAGEDSIEARIVGSVPVALFLENALPGSGTQITVASGDAQVDTIGTTLPTPLTVLVTDVYGNPSPYQFLVFSVLSGNGVLSSDTVQTDVSGNASSQYTLGALPATDTIRATLVQNGSFAEFTAIAVAGSPTSLTTHSGDGQTDTVLAVLSDSLVVELRDGSDRPVPGAWIFWTPTQALVSDDSTLTDVNGHAAVQVTLGSSTSIAAQVVARTADSSLTATFTPTILPGAPSGMSYVEGDAQTGEVGTSLVTAFTFNVVDAWGNPVPNIPVAFVRVFGNGTPSPDTAYTDVSGNASSSYTLGSVPGTDTIAARLPATGTEFTLTAFAVAGPAASMSYVAGTGQSDTVARALPTPFQVTVQDALGNPRSDVWVKFTKTAATGVLAADSVITDASGVAEVTYTLGTVTGFDTVTATLAGLADTVTFYAFAENEVAASIAVFSGDSASAIVGQSTAAPVVFVVRDVYGNPVGDQSVGIFGAPGSSSPQYSEVTTGDDGLASAGFWTVDANPGYNTLTAQAGSFTATATAIGLPLGATNVWTGAVSTDWNTAGNWMTGSVANINDTAFVPAGTPHDPVLANSVNVGRLVVAGAVTFDLGSYDLISSNGVDGPAATFTGTTGQVSVHGGSWNSTSTNLQVDSVTLAGGSVTGNLIVASGGFDMGGNTLVVGGNVTTYGPLTMGNEGDSLDVGGDFTVNFTDMNGATSAGTIVLRGDFTSSSLFRPVGTNVVVFAGASAQQASFADWTSSWFRTLVIDNSAGVQFTSNLQVTGGVQQVAGHVAGAAASIDGGLVVAADTAWAFSSTALLGTSFIAPDTISGTVSLQYSAATALPGDFTVLGDLYLQSADVVDVGPNALHVTGQLYQAAATSGLVVPAFASSVEVGGLFSVASNANDFSNGTLTLHGGIRQYGGSLFRPSSTFTTVFAGTSGQLVQFDTPGSGVTQSSFGPVEIADSVDLATNTWFLGGVTMQAGGKLTSATASISGDLVGATWDNWRPGTTVFETALTTLADSLYSGVQFEANVALAKPFTVGGTLQAIGELDLNGWPLTVGGDLKVPGTIRMANAGDSLDVAGNIDWGLASSASPMSDGVLVIRGNFASFTAGNAFQPSGAHRSVFEGSGAHTVQTYTAGGSNYFNHVELRGTGGLLLTAPMQVNGAFTEALGSQVAITGDVELTATGAVSLDDVVFDSTGLIIDTDSPLSLNALTFRNRPLGTNLDIRIPGIEGVTTFQNFIFEDTGKAVGAYYVHAEDRSGNSYPVMIHMASSTPLDGTGFTDTPQSNDGATVLWSRLEYQSQPLSGTAGSTLSPVDVRVVGPDGITLGGYSGDITIGISSNPANGTLFGTTTVAASGGIANFNDLMIDSVGTNYKLVATGIGLGPVVSDDFNIVVPLPVDFTTAWVGGVSTDWNDPANWSTGLVPDATANVFISQPYANAPVSTSSVLIGKLQVAPGATLQVASSVFQADSSVEAYGTITGAGSFQPSGVGFITGDIQVQTVVSGDYTVTGTLRVTPELAVAGHLLASTGDSVIVTGLFGTVGGTGILTQDASNAVVLVNGDASFDGGSTTGTLTDGLFLVSGGLTTSGAHADAFAPSGAHNTILNGSANQLVYFNAPDTANGSHFNHLQVSTAGHAVMSSSTWITGNLLVTNGAILEDTLDNGIAALGATTVDLGGTLRSSRFATEGVLNVASGGTYAVPLTVYYGAGAPLPIRAAPYDTVLIARDAYAYEGFSTFGDLRIEDGYGSPARFDLKDKTVAIGHDVRIQGDGALIMQDGSGQLNVAGSFSTNGADSRGLLTAGTLQIDGNFDQAADGSGESFRAGGTHTTVFTATGTGRYIDFDSPSGSPSDSNGSHFRNLVLQGPGTAMQGRVAASGGITIDGSVTQYEGLGKGLASYGSTTIAATSDSVDLDFLEVWGGLIPQGSGLYAVETTSLMGGGGTLPALSYYNLQIANADFTLGADQGVGGNLTVGIFCSEICTSSPGGLAVGGHVLTVSGGLNVMGLGLLDMATGDSVDAGSVFFRGAPSDGHLTGGTLVVRGLFNTADTDAFQASAAHRTVLLASGANDIYPSPNTWFGSLVLLDGAPRRIRTSSPLVVLDTLILGATTSGLNDTLGFFTGSIVARGPVVTATGSSIYMDGSVQFDNDTILIDGAYQAEQTTFGGPNTDIPALPYRNLSVLGNARLTDSIDVTGYSVGVGDSAGGSLDLQSYTLRAQNFQTGGLGTLTMAFPSANLVVDGIAMFAGGSESGKLTEGTATFKGNFFQDATNSSASYYSSVNHTTIFADSTFGGSQATVASMLYESSKFNHVLVYGHGVNFIGSIAVSGDFKILDPMVDSVGGSDAGLYGDLIDTLPGQTGLWKVDLTYIRSANPILPDSIGGSLYYAGGPDSLEQGLVVEGDILIQDTLTPHPGGVLKVLGNLNSGALGLLKMTYPSQQVTVVGNATFDGATATGWMTAGVLNVGGDFTVGPTNGFAFDATGNHQTNLTNGLTGMTVSFASGSASGFQNLDYANAGLTITSDLLVRGDLSSSGETAGPIYGGAHFVMFGDGASVEQGIDFNNTRVRIPQTLGLFDVDFSNQDPDSAQIMVVGAGSPEALQLGNIRFHTMPTTGALVYAIDTLPGNDSLQVQMLSSTPFSPVEYDRTAGEAAIEWGHLVVTTFPVSIDSLVPFEVKVAMINPGGQPAGIGGSATISLASNPAGATLGGTLNQGSSFSAFDFNDLTLDKVAAGVSFHIAIDGQPTDTITTGTVDVINPAPVGSIAWDGEGGDGKWGTAANWIGDVVPTPSDSAFIGGGTSVFVTDSSFAVGGIVLGQGASLNIDPGQQLTVTGRLTAGNTIYGNGNLVLAGSVMPVSGAINAPTTITGSVVTVGQVSFGGNLTVDGSGAELNVGGASVQVYGDFSTVNGGILTMDSDADTLRVYNAHFDGGSTDGTLTDGVLVIQGGDFSQGGPSSTSFAASGAHTTIFEDYGDNSGAQFASGADNAHFGNLRINTPNGVDFTTPEGKVRATGRLELADGAVATSDSFDVGGGLYMEGTGSSLNAQMVRVAGLTSTIQGSWNVEELQLDGTAQDLPAFDAYNRIVASGTQVNVMGPVRARSITVTSGLFHTNGTTVSTDTLDLVGTGSLGMLQSTDTVVVDSFARFQAGSSPLIAGLLELHGDLKVGDGATYFNAAPAHVTKFTGAASHWLDLPGEASATFGTLVVDTGTANIDQDFEVEGDLVLNDGAVRNNNDGSPVLTVLGNILGDTGSNTGLDFAAIDAYGGLSFNGDTANFQVPVVRMWGSGFTIQSGFPFRTLMVLGSGTLGGVTQAQYLVVDGSGDLLMGGNTLTVDSMIVSSNAHLRMQNSGDQLTANGWVMFQGDSSEGDYTAGTIRAANFIAQTGPSGDARSFVETGTHRIVPLAGDTIQMLNAGPAASRLTSLVLSSLGGTIYAGELWISDSLIIDGPSEGIVGIEGDFQVTVGSAGSNVGKFEMLDGTLEVDALAVGGTFVKMDGSYDVPLTKFIGSGQTIPGGLPYQDVEVQYSAALGGDVTLSGSGKFEVNNFGDLDMAGHDLTAVEFHTNGYGRLTMTDSTETLTANAVYFYGDSTNLSITSGQIVTQYLDQQASTSSKSYAPSGDHRLIMQDLGTTGDGLGLSFQTPGVDASHANILQATNRNVILVTPVVVTDSLLINETLNGMPGQAVIDVYGPAIFGPAANVSLDTLTVHDTLAVDPSATFSAGITIFSTGAAPMPASFPYGNVGVEGVQTLTGDVSINGTLILRQAGELHLNTHKLTLASDFAIYDTARLVMANVTDTLAAANAYFYGSATGNDLSAGAIALSGGMVQSDSVSTQSFRPTGTKVRFLGNGTSYVTFESPDSATGSFLNDASIEGATHIQAVTGLTTVGSFTVDTAAVFAFYGALTGADQVHHWGPVTVLPGGLYSNPSFATSTFHSAPSVLGGFSVQYAGLDGVSFIPNLPWNNLSVKDGGNIVLGSDLTLSGFLTLNALAEGGQDIAFNGKNVTVSGLATNGYATITMTNAGDTLDASGGVFFYGGDESGKMSAGMIRTGGGLLEGSTTSTTAFYSTGTVVEFTNTTYGASVQLDNAATAQFDGIQAPNGNTLWLSLQTQINNVGQMKAYSYNLWANPGILVTADTIYTQAGSGTFDIERVKATALAIGGPTPTWTVEQTEFTGNGEIPDLPYDTLIVSGSDTLQSHDLTANWIKVFGNVVVDNGYTLHGTKVITVAGPSAVLENKNGFVNADSLFQVIGGAQYISQVGAAGGSVGDVFWGTTQPSSNLIAGGLDIMGDFTVGASDNFVAGPGFVTNFTGGGNHVISTGQVGGAVFGELSAAPETTEGDSITIAQFGIEADKLNLTNQVRVIGAGFGNGAALKTAELAVTSGSGTSAIFERVLLTVYSLSSRPLVFNNVVFTGYAATDGQLNIIHPGQGAPFFFNNIDFDDVAENQTGFGLQVQDIDGLAPFLSVQVASGPDFGKNLLKAISPALLSWFAS